MVQEKRRYFRIDDTMDLAFRAIRPQTPELKLSTEILDDAEVLERVDAELDTLVNSLWNSDPKYARAIGLLNQKINLLTNQNRPSLEELMAQYDHQYSDIDVNISASGMAFDCNVELEVGGRLEMLLILKPSGSGVKLKGVVVNSEDRQSSSGESYFTCVQFDIEGQEKEQLIQHIVRRQVETMGNKEEAM